ncbi:MAG: tetratricopeptide repeat protein [Gammaproteobacteria bacterium]
MKQNSVYKYSLVMVLALLMLTACAIEPSRKPGAADKEVVVSVDSDVQQLFDQAVQALSRDEYDNAITLLNTVIEREQRLTAPYINLAMAYRRQGDDEKAEENLMKALDLDLAHPVANNELGLLYRKLGRFADARKAYTNALTEHPDYLPVIKNLGILCDLYMRDLQCALEQFEKYQSQAPDDKTMQIWIADLKRRIGS